MSQLGNYQVGTLKSIPKLTKINGDDSKAVVWRNLGNNHAYPFIWGHSVTLISGTSEVTLASGVKFHGFDLATYANVTITETNTPTGPDLGGYGPPNFYVEKNTDNNIMKLKSTAVSTNFSRTFDVKYMLGEDVEITGMNCDGMWSGMPPTGYRTM